MPNDSTPASLANNGTPPKTQPIKIDPVKADDFLKRADALSVGGLSVEQIDVLYALDIDIQAAVTRAVEALGFADEITAIPAIYWIAGNFPGVPAAAIAEGLPSASLKTVRNYRYQALRYTSGRLYAEDAEGLRSLPYSEYLETEHWQMVRADALTRSNHACQLCKARGELHVHHNTYERRGEELDSDVIVLCADCHKVFHDNGKVVR